MNQQGAGTCPGHFVLGEPAMEAERQQLPSQKAAVPLSHGDACPCLPSDLDKAKN